MASNIVTAVVAFAGGVIISLINSKLTSNAIKENKTGMSTSIIFIRQALNIGYFLLVFLIARNNFNIGYALIGAAFGLTIPSIIYAAVMTKKLSVSADKQENNKNG